ncbi:hypothetical protein KCP75_17570 [Salmonella enterica subsp. enterica]|nr:hypothetical protein KCP75_17570 [Salmonella enterica subsp. enterica]
MAGRARLIICDHLDLLKYGHDFRTLCALPTKEEGVKEAVNLIQSLDPQTRSIVRPASEYVIGCAGTQARSLDGGLNSDGIPRLQISSALCRRIAIARAQRCRQPVHPQ